MMMNSKRSDGRRLILVIALIGILSTYGTSAQNVQVADTTANEESSEPATVAVDQPTVEGLTATTEAETTASETQELTTGTSVGETATSLGVSLPGGTSDGQTGDTVGETSIAREGTVETTTSVGESSTDQVRTRGDEAGVESSTGGTEGGTTAAVREASSAGATGTEKQTTEGETTAAFTGATSTDGGGGLGAAPPEETTGATTAEESLTTSVKQTSNAADAQYTTNVGDKSTERQTETTVPSKVTVAAVNSTLAPTGCGSKQSCGKCQTIKTKASSADRPQWTISGSVWEAEGKFYAEFVVENQRNPNQREILKKSRTQRKYNCTNEVNRFVTKLKSFKKSNSSAPMPSTTPTPRPTVPIERKRRQADQPTTSAPSDESIEVEVDIGFDDMKILLRGSMDDDDDEEDTSDSIENTSHSSAESGTTSGTASTTLTVGKNEPSEVLPKSVVDQTQPESKNVWDAHRGIFLTVLIIISVCVVVTGFCCLVMKCRERGQNRNSEKQPIAMEEAREAHPTSASNPIPDHEMIQDEAPMQERENPAVTPNGGGQHISKADEDNGWVVPLDELSNAEKEKPEVENTRL